MMRDLRQETFLKEMGYTLWQLRQGGECRGKYHSPADGASVGIGDDAVQRRGGYHPPASSASTGIERRGGHHPPASRLPEKTSDNATLLPPPHEPSVPEMSDATRDERAKAIALMDWEDLTEAIRECRACELCKHRKQTVPGVGDRAAEWLFIGEGPGAEEDARGEPFVGQAGRLLDAMLSAIGLKRGENVYIANAVKCRPEGNRTPLPAEMAVCRPFLMRQIALISPSVIVLLGKAATHSVLEDDASLASLRRKTHGFGDIPVVVTYHPAYLLRNLPEKAKSWEDLCLARKIWREARGKG